MSGNSVRRIGLTPAFLRTAYYYLCLGFGTYTPESSSYDKVVVKPLYEFGGHPDRPDVIEEHAGGVVVEFYKEGRKTRSLDFRCQVVGWSGFPVLRPVSDEDAS